MAQVDLPLEQSWGSVFTAGSTVLGVRSPEHPLEFGGVMSRFLNVLRSWLVMVSIIAIGNTLQSFRDHTFLYEKLYTGKPNLVNGLQARTFGIWTLLSSVIRCLCAIDIHNKTYVREGRALASFCWKSGGSITSHSGPSSSPWGTSSPSCLYLELQHPRLASWPP
ncbi:ergosterol biosynthetic protein 28 homolog isoform X4 [Sciurus carolinensis]|uniref:ergosterol biosynthetic protein 28 homolog isoform X4 n=1 Tax=Sciurus carolinensis TaxID=30640 RepID=UPI001FB45AB0|nr:ergosterol biosynthetic protein 28 homolog isoform X4 [Sciurus carolinensis]